MKKLVQFVNEIEILTAYIFNVEMQTKHINLPWPVPLYTDRHNTISVVYHICRHCQPTKEKKNITTGLRKHIYFGSHIRTL